MTDLTMLASTLTLSERKIAIPQSPGRPRHVGSVTPMGEAEPIKPEIVPDIVTSAVGSMPSTIAFDFIRLPTEIRLQIYRWLLVSKVRLKVTMSEVPNIKAAACGDQQIPQVNFHHDLSNNDIFPQVLTTCRHINDEATPTLYGTNIWHFVVNQWFQHFLHRIGPHNASLIRYCQLRGYALDVPEWSLAVAPCMMMNRLRAFEICLSSHESRRPRGHSERILGEESKTIKALFYMRMLLQVHPSLRAVIRSKLDCRAKLDCGTSAFGYNLMLVSEEYRLEGADRYVDFETEMALAFREGRSAHLSVFLH